MSVVSRRFSTDSPVMTRLRLALQKTGVDVRTFFRTAHTWCYGTSPNVRKDVHLFETECIIPVYVERYLERISE